MGQPDIQKVLPKLKPLLSTLIKYFTTGDYNLRRESAIALSKFKGEHATDFLLKNFESDNIQDFMALALGNIESQKAVKLLINALNDTQTEVRFHAARALGMIKNNEAFNVLMEALNEYADSSAAGISQNRQNQLFFEEDAIISAITALGKIKNHLSTALLKRIHAQEKSPRIRASVIMALGAMANERMLPIFQAALRDEDSRVRANAIEAIESIKSSAIVGILQPYLEDPSNRVKANVAKAIWKYGDFDVSDTLSQMLSHADKWQRASAAYAMSQIKDIKFIPKLAAALKDEDPDVRRNAVTALRQIESPNAIPHLTPLLEDPNYEVRVHATLAIARCNPTKAPDLLAPRMAEEKNPNVRATLISVLGESGRANFRESIEGFLDDEDARVVSNAIDSIQKLTQGSPYPKLTKKLKSLLAHEDNRVKSNAIKALWHWNEFDVLDNLHDLILNDDLKYRQSGIFVLGEIGTAISLNADLCDAVNDLIHALITGKEPEPAKPAPIQANQTAPLPPETPLAAPVAGKVPSKPEAAPPPRNEEEEEQSFDDEIDRAANAFNAKEFSEAEKIYQKILAAQPRNLKALMGAGNLYFIQKRYSEASETYSRALEINPNLVKAHYNLGSILYFQKDHENAKEHLMKALKLYPKILGAYLILSQIFQAGDKIKESIQLLAKAIELSPRNPILYQKLAVLQFQVKDFDGATQVLSKAISLSPNDVESNVLLAFSQKMAGKYLEAFDSIDAALNACATSSKPEDALQVLLQGYMYFKSDVEPKTSKTEAV